MSFSSEAKGELCRVSVGHSCCAQAEAYGILLYCNQFSGQEIRIVTESGYLAQRLPELFQAAFQLCFDQVPGLSCTGKQIFSIQNAEKLHRIYDVFGYEPAGSVAHHINFAVLEEEHCRTAFFRGAFLSGGSVTDPGKRYHLELTTPHYHVSRELLSLLLDAGFSPKESTRKANYIIYFKQSEAIEHFLAYIGAPEAAAQIVSARQERSLLGRINRRVNCDAANLDKTVEAAMEQVECIGRLKDSGRLSELPDKLKQTALLRMEYPELTLSQLAELCTPPVTKSCLNHRLRKLMELANGAE